MTLEQIDQLTAETQRQIPELIGTLAPHIREAAAAVLEETQEQENGKPYLSIGLRIKVYLASSPLAIALKGSVAVTRTAEAAFELEDPNQIPLPIE